MRKKAIEKGYLLNEYGLLKDGEYHKGKTEEEVFEVLDMKYVPPEKRIWVYNLKVSQRLTMDWKMKKKKVIYKSWDIRFLISHFFSL